MNRGNKSVRIALLFIVFIIAVPASRSFAGMTSYCQNPPFIVGGVQPNLLLMIDNSASMYDLGYVDQGSASRPPTYCYDQTYSSANSYEGYFDRTDEDDNTVYYSYDFTNNYFRPGATFPGSCTYRNNSLCIDVLSGSATQFVASGNYLNWLTSSKFDIEKKILTGGKYDTATQELLEDSRGCVGRKFIKEALTADYVEGGTNTSLGITFGIKGGLPNPNNPTAPTQGRTYIDVYVGDYNEQLCQDAIQALQDPNSSNADRKKAVDDCLSATTSSTAYCQLDPTYNGGSCTKDSDCILSDGTCINKTCSAPAGRVGIACNNDADCNSSVGPCVTSTATTQSKTEVVFNQSMQACWAYENGTPISIDDVNTVENQCSDIYNENGVCRYANAGMACTQSSDCGAGGFCALGPGAIKAGNPAYLCSNAYAGRCATTTRVCSNQTNKKCSLDSDCPGGYCASWLNVTWVAKIFPTPKDCVIYYHEQFCNQLQIPPVTDPTDAPSDTSNYDNLPAIISDIGIEAQLNQPIASLSGVVKTNSEPKNLIQKYAGQIRFGTMIFNDYGSQTECTATCSNNLSQACTQDSDCGTGQCLGSGSLPCTMTCSGSVPPKVCSSDLDCSGQPCSVGSTNVDGASIISYIGDPIGDHSSGLINSIDQIDASTWTPYSEAFYNAIGYFAKTASGTSRTDLRLNTDDFLDSKNPSQYRCQKNNILLISDGQPTADLNPSVTNLVNQYHFTDSSANASAANAYDTSVNNTCYQYSGSRNVDDLAWLAYTHNIADFSQPVSNGRDNIKTYVVYTGTDDPSKTGECNPTTLMNNTAQLGGTGSAYNPSNPQELYNALDKVFNSIMAQTASGTAASVLASGEGSGANMIQAIFYPGKQFSDGTIVNWTGAMQNFWYYIDPFFANNSIREDTDQNNVLELNKDNIAVYGVSGNNTVINLFADSNGDGVADSATPVSTVNFDSAKSIWESGKILFTTDPDLRTVYTSTDGSTLIPFDSTEKSVLQPYLTTTDATQAGRLIDYVRGVDDVNGNGTYGATGSSSLDGDSGDTIDGDVVRNRALTLNGVKNTWKLGDIIASTPKIVSWVPLNAYDKVYRDSTYSEFTSTPGYKSRGMVFVGANDGMLHAFKLGTLNVFSEQFKKASLTGTSLGSEQWAFIPKNVLPYLKYLAKGEYCHIYSVDATPLVFDASINADLTAAGQNTFCTSSAYWKCNRTEKSWKTVLIGSMRLGGACRDSTSTCTDCVKTPVSGVGYSSFFALDITNPANPSLMWERTSEDLGFSTSGPQYVRTSGITGTGLSGAMQDDKNGRWFVVFATGPSGYIEPTTHQFTGIAEHLNDKGKMKLLVYDLASGSLIKEIDTGNETSIFAGSILGSSVDIDRNYQDDAMYFGYNSRAADIETGTAQGGTANTITLGAGAQALNDYYDGYFVQLHSGEEETRLIISYDGATKTATIDGSWKSPVPDSTTVYGVTPGWITGGIKTLVTKEDIDPANWFVKDFVTNIGPVTSSVAYVNDLKNNRLWVYFSTGRFYYRMNNIIDDSIENTNDPGTGLPYAQQALFGAKDPCVTSSLKFDPACTDFYDSPIKNGLFDDVTTSLLATPEATSGWYIRLDLSNANFEAERSVSSPTGTPSGAVLFTSTMPSGDMCSYGGSSAMWATCFLNGGPMDGSTTKRCQRLKGKALFQVSSGEIKQISLDTAFTQSLGRRTEDTPGYSGENKPPILSSPNPTKKVIMMMGK